MLKVCNNCVMDTSDSSIVFDHNGVCDHCNDFYDNIMPDWQYGKGRENQLLGIIDKIKKDGKGRDFDCILGMSGGVDSSYLLHVAVKKFGLRPLVFHVDGGWNSDIAVNNIEKLVDGLSVDLYTEVINWEEMRDFQLAYIKSGLSNIDVPQDHAFISTLYNFASKYNIKYILNGGNISTECVRNPLQWLYYGTDMSQINYIIKKFGTNSMKTYPFSSVLRHKIYLKYIRRINVVKPLNYISYVKNDALTMLNEEYGWLPYPQKHYESRFTKFYEGYWLPEKFGYDTRKVQYSSLILTGQMKRDDALQMLSKPAIPKEEVDQEFEYVATKLGISTDELNYYLNQPNKHYSDYPNRSWMFDYGAKVLKSIGVEGAIKR